MREPDRVRLAAVSTAAMLALAAVVVLAVGGLPIGQARSIDGGERRAAVAIRDHVIPFQKWGTRMFTLPRLEEAYHRVYYLTQGHRGDKREELVAALTDALNRHEAVDVFLLAHGNRFVEWAAAVPPELRVRLRLVYNTGCGQARQADEWLELGADAYVGHPSPRSLSPVFYYFFLRYWTAGHVLADAVAQGNGRADRRLDWLGQTAADVRSTAHLFGDGQLWVAR